MIKMQDITKDQYVSQQEGNIVSDMDGEKVMLSIQNGKYYNLGETGGVIWDEMKNPIVISALVSNLVSQFDVDRAVCEEQVMSFLSHLAKEGLINIE